VPEEKPIAFPDAAPAVPRPDEKAKAESAGFERGVNLSNQRSINALGKLRRKDKIDIHLHRITCLAIYLIGIALILCVLIIIASYCFPKAWNVFDPEQISRLREFIFTGALGAVINEGRKRITKDSADEEE